MPQGLRRQLAGDGRGQVFRRYARLAQLAQLGKLLVAHRQVAALARHEVTQLLAAVRGQGAFARAGIVLAAHQADHF